MLKAHSLLYAVYVCLIVSILCGALLYFASLYNQLNLFYNTNEELYIQNQSAVNYVLGSPTIDINDFQEDSSAVKSDLLMKPFGLLNLLIVKSYNTSDTICSVHFVGRKSNDKTCIYLSKSSKALSYSGTVKLIGSKKLPSPYIEELYFSNTLNNITSVGSLEIAGDHLPEINPNFKKTIEKSSVSRLHLKDVERTNDSIYFNSFLNETIEVELTNPILENVVIKGNFVLHSKDSIQVKSSAVLEDVILKAPSISFKKEFRGNVQAFAYRSLRVEKSVELSYPSILCVYNTSTDASKLIVDENSKIYGGVVLFGNPITTIDDNQVVLNKNSLLIGDVYCSGKIMIEGSVYGSVYTNRFFHKTSSGNYENSIINAEIDVSKKPTYFVSIPLFKENNESYEVYKKVL